MFFSGLKWGYDHALHLIIATVILLPVLYLTHGSKPAVRDRGGKCAVGCDCPCPCSETNCCDACNPVKRKGRK